jgi:prevent-host-death family protein
MTEIGVRELKTHASEILRSVRETRTRYTVTYRGRPVAVLTPLPEGAERTSGGEDVWKDLERLGDEITRGWQSPQTSTEILSEMRR